MSNGDDSLDLLFGALDELEKREILRLANLLDDRPDILRRGTGSLADRRAWMGTRRPRIADVLLRVVDPTDEEIARLSADGHLRVAPPGPGARITLSLLASPTVDPDYQTSAGRIPVTDLAVTTGLLVEIFVVLARANRPLGVDLAPPALAVMAGSIQFSIGGGLFATGIGLLVACIGGLVAMPLGAGVLAGTTLAGTGLFDLALSWKKTIAESGKLDAEHRKLNAEAAKLEAEAKKLDLEATKLRLETATSQETRFAASALIPRSIVRHEAERWSASEPYANHVLNRGLPTLLQARLYLRDITVDQLPDFS